MKASGKAHVTGWVQNQRDGTVDAETQGSPKQQEQFLKRLATLMPGYDSDWHDDRQIIDPIDGEQAFCVHK